MRRGLVMTVVLWGGLLAWGCGNKGEGEAAKAAAGPAATTAATAPPSTAVPGPRSSGPTSVAAPPRMPPGRSAPPTLEEWGKLRKEVTVKGSSALRCETKIIREYLRVVCTGKLDPAGTPTAVAVLKGGAEAMAFAHGGVASLIVPYTEGTHLEAVFSWTHKSHKLVARWPKGDKQPVIVGAFEGAESPLDGPTRGDDAKLCACHQKVTGAASCEDLYGGSDADCDRTFGNDCAALLACARGERMARCLPGFFNGPAYTGSRCFKVCGPGQPACPGGWTCSQFDAEVFGCMR